MPWNRFSAEMTWHYWARKGALLRVSCSNMWEKRGAEMCTASSNRREVDGVFSLSFLAILEQSMCQNSRGPLRKYVLHVKDR